MVYLCLRKSSGEEVQAIETKEMMHVPPDSIIQEHDLEWAHEGRDDGESILSDASHVALMWHNYSNVE